jgi:uncharacterized phage protein (predicted DNA packaging)
MLEKIKLALRISHNLLDADINDSILEARAEMLRSGVPAEVADSEHPLVRAAIKVYCLANYATDADMAEGYQESWRYQLDNLRKSHIESEAEEKEGGTSEE